MSKHINFGKNAHSHFAQVEYEKDNYITKIERITSVKNWVQFKYLVVQKSKQRNLNTSSQLVV